MRIDAQDDLLLGLVGQTIGPDAGVAYRLVEPLRRGGMSIPFLARRQGPDGEVPVVIKILRPSFIRKAGDAAGVVVRKEAVALGRLNEQVPPTPFVVRLIDTGALTVDVGGQPMELPWVAVEHVPGGALGSTLTQRVKRSIELTGSAFDPTRAAYAIECIAQGLAAVHEVGVIHRDLTPGNVLGTGSGTDEIFKISDFGVARPIGFTGTLAGAPVGTPGFAAPELGALDERAVGTWTDVFSFSAVMYFLLTGELLFSSRSEVMQALESSKRRSILDAPGLCPELRDREPTCRSIDLVISWASAGIPESRLAEALAVSAMVTPHLKSAAEAGSGPRPTLRSHLPPKEDSRVEGPELWTWTKLYQGGHSRVFRSVAWDGYGRSVAATNEGLLFWNGTTWSAADTAGIERPEDLHFIRRVGAGRFLLGGDAPELYVYTTGGVTDRVPAPRGAGRLEALAGDLDDIAVLLSSDEAGQPQLHTRVTGRWLKPLPLTDVVAVTGLARVDDARWLVTGRRHGGGAYAALYSALDWELVPIEVPPSLPTLMACSGMWRHERGIATGPDGAVLCWRSGVSTFETVPGRPSLPAAGLDPFARPWAAGMGSVWTRDDTGWRVLWEDPSWVVPIVSLFLDTGLCFAMSADGGIVEGRAGRTSLEESAAL